MLGRFSLADSSKGTVNSAKGCFQAADEKIYSSSRWMQSDIAAPYKLFRNSDG